jgi:hypothetical protein
MLTFWTLLRSPLARGIGAAIALAAVAWGAYLAVDHRGYSRCERDHELVDLHAAEEAHQYLLAEVKRGDAISAELAKTQGKLNATKTEYLAYANSIRGHCPGDLGLFLGTETLAPPAMPSTPGALTGSAPPVDAAQIAANIAENRWRFELNRAQCAALINWHTGKKDMTQ